MKTSSLAKNITYKADRANVEPIFETSFSKEMKEHQTPYPIVVELFEGKIDFGVNGEVLHLEKGDILSLDGAIAHNLIALEDSIVRLTLSKHDKVERVENVSKQ